MIPGWTVSLRFSPLMPVALVGWLGCLPGGDDALVETMCDVQSDCDFAEVCDEGICWGNPPTAQFAALLVPPADEGDDLAVTEIPWLDIYPT